MHPVVEGEKLEEARGKIKGLAREVFEQRRMAEEANESYSELKARLEKTSTSSRLSFSTGAATSLPTLSSTRLGGSSTANATHRDLKI